MGKALFCRPKMKQITKHILMVRPAAFGFNPETAADNAFQQQDASLGVDQIRAGAQKEFDAFVQQLRDAGVDVLVAQDSDDPMKPDAVFPNNWVSFHANSTVYTYPMYASVRRHERRQSILDMIEKKFEMQAVFNLENFEDKGIYLEGTGSIVFDRVNRIAYACLSERTHEVLFEKYCKMAAYRKHLFHAVDAGGRPIYHTNVMMAMGTSFVVVCMDSVRDEAEKASLRRSFAATEKEVVNISLDQMNSFAGNMLQVQGSKGSLLVLSEQAFASLDSHQVNRLERHTELLVASIPTIEKFGGGSVRCMMAEVFLPPKHID
ncbi:MAG: arginine deiminase-related protein [Bacteroidota bacterium]